MTNPYGMIPLAIYGDTTTQPVSDTTLVMRQLGMTTQGLILNAAQHLALKVAGRVESNYPSAPAVFISVRIEVLPTTPNLAQMP